jgi:hypothetical protein
MYVGNEHIQRLNDERMEKKRKRKDYAFRRQFNEKPSIIPGCPGERMDNE